MVLAIYLVEGLMHLIDLLDSFLGREWFFVVPSCLVMTFGNVLYLPLPFFFFFFLRFGMCETF